MFDSVHAPLLADAHVVAVGTGAQSELRREATSDSTGHYHIDSLPEGGYVVGFESALLDSLEVTLSPRKAAVVPGSRATLDLALPTATKLRSAVCLGAEHARREFRHDIHSIAPDELTSRGLAARQVRPISATPSNMAEVDHAEIEIAQGGRTRHRDHHRGGQRRQTLEHTARRCIVEGTHRIV